VRRHGSNTGSLFSAVILPKAMRQVLWMLGCTTSQRDLRAGFQRGIKAPFGPVGFQPPTSSDSRQLETVTKRESTEFESEAYTGDGVYFNVLMKRRTKKRCNVP